MPGIDNFTPEMKERFNALPKYVQENILQSGAQVKTVEELKSIAKKLEGREK